MHLLEQQTSYVKCYLNPIPNNICTYFYLVPSAAADMTLPLAACASGVPCLSNEACALLAAFGVILTFVMVKQVIKIFHPLYA